MSKTALLIIDVQKGMFAFPEMQPHEGRTMINNLNELIVKARKANAPIVFIQHAGSSGHPLEKGTDGYDLVADLKAHSDDSYIRKSKCGCFNETDLQSTLQNLGVENLIIGGMQTEFCVDTAIRSANDHGYDVTAIEGGHSTFANETLSAAEIIRHHSAIWQQGFGKVLPVNEINFAPSKA